MMARVAARCQARHPENPEARRPSSSESPTPGHPEPEQFPKTPGVAVPSPRAGSLRTINQLLVIFIYILWLMFNDLYIWCYVHHA
jgi:hypothetical protein